jgi:hypothetical protein
MFLLLRTVVDESALPDEFLDIGSLLKSALENVFGGLLGKD